MIVPVTEQRAPATELTPKLLPAMIELPTVTLAAAPFDWIPARPLEAMTVRMMLTATASPLLIAFTPLEALLLTELSDIARLTEPPAVPSTLSPPPLLPTI